MDKLATRLATEGKERMTEEESDCCSWLCWCKPSSYTSLLSSSLVRNRWNEPLVNGNDDEHTTRWQREMNAPQSVNCGVAFHDLYVLGDQIGKGSTAVVHKCTRKHSTLCETRAVKIIDKRRMALMYNELLEQFRREVDILARLDHPHIIKLYGMYESKHSLHLVTEYAGGGELFDYLVSRPKGLLSEAEASHLVRQVISAVSYLHENGVVHRDIKLENILLSKGPMLNRFGESPGSDQQIELKLIDFGLAKSIMESSTTTKTFFGTVGYIAPEMLSRKPYTKAVDVWALGVLTFILLCGVFPFEDDIRKKAKVDYQLRFPPWTKNKISSSAKDLLEKLLCVDPSHRISARAGLNHPWVQGATASPNLVLRSPSKLRHLASQTCKNVHLFTSEPRKKSLDRRSSASEDESTTSTADSDSRACEFPSQIPPNATSIGNRDNDTKSVSPLVLDIPIVDLMPEFSSLAKHPDL